MEIIIRKPSLEPKVDGIPKDFHDIMKYFNEAIQNGLYTYLPRKYPITKEEILNLWIPNLKENISFVAELNNKIVGSATVFFNPDSNKYGKEAERQSGEIGLTVNPNQDYKKIAKLLIAKIIETLKSKNKTAILHSDISKTETKEIMEELGYKEKMIEGYERYQKAGMSGQVFEYSLP